MLAAMAGSHPTLIVICSAGHLFRSRELLGSPGDTGTTGCPVCAARVGVRVVDPRLLSQEALAEAWQHRGIPW
jgi:hypothetical protein